MKLATTLVTMTLAALALAGCGGGGPEGTYKLDKAEVKKNAEAQIAKLPAEQQKFAQLGLAMIEAMDMSLELQPGGTLVMKSSMPSLDKDKPAKTDEKKGTWKLDGDAVVIDDGKQPIKCNRGGGKLTCEGKKADDPKLVFVKG